MEGTIIMNAHTSTFGNQHGMPELPAPVFPILSNWYDSKDQLRFVPKETYESLLGSEFCQKLGDAADRNDQCAAEEMRLGICFSLADAGCRFCPFGVEIIFSILFQPQRFIALYELLADDQPVERVDGLDAFIWGSGSWVQLQFVLAALHYKSNADTLGQFVGRAWKTGHDKSIMTASFGFKTCSDLFEASSQRGLNMDASAPTKAISKTLYRGGGFCPSLSHGMSWTEDRDVAVFFAKRLNKAMPAVLTTKTSTNRVLARFEHESEAVLAYDTNRSFEVEFV
jgi:hypothetical protein